MKKTFSSPKLQWHYEDLLNISPVPAQTRRWFCGAMACRLGAEEKRGTYVLKFSKTPRKKALEVKTLKSGGIDLVFWGHAYEDVCWRATYTALAQFLVKHGLATRKQRTIYVSLKRVG